MNHIDLLARLSGMQGGTRLQYLKAIVCTAYELHTGQEVVSYETVLSGCCNKTIDNPSIEAGIDKLNEFLKCMGVDFEVVYDDAFCKAVERNFTKHFDLKR